MDWAFAVSPQDERGRRKELTGMDRIDRIKAKVKR
jgi:hypothetical protein